MALASGLITRPIAFIGVSPQTRRTAAKINLLIADPRDPYYFAVALSWPRFLLSLVALYAPINVSFALLYLARREIRMLIDGTDPFVAAKPETDGDQLSG
jgi:hypothetical protein